MSAAPTSAFPDQAAHAMDAQLGFVTKQNEMVPGWYRIAPHPDPDNTVVKQDGVPVVPRFTVGQMAYGRRWVVGMDGNLMGQNEFEVKLRDVRLEFYALLRSQGRNAQYTGDVTFESVPTVLKFASAKPDPEDERRVMYIHYDPHKTAGAKPKHFVDKQGERLKGSRLEILRSAYRDADLHTTLTPKELSEVEASFTPQEVLDIRASWDAAAEVASGEPSPLKDKLDRLGQLLASGDMDEDTYKQRVAALVGASPPEPKPEKAAAKPKRKRGAPMHTAACGERVLNFNKSRHKATCEKPECAAAREDTG